MSNVLLCDRLSSLKAGLKGISGPFRYISLIETQESFQIRSYLQQHPDARELPRAQLFRERSDKFRKSYIDTMGQINGRNHSLEWWAMPFTNKNPLATQLCRQTFQFLLIVELTYSSQDALVVVTDDADLVAQVKAWGNTHGVPVVSTVKEQRSWKSFVQRFTPGNVLYAFLRTLWLSLRTRRLRIRSETGTEYTVLASLFHPQSLSEPGKYRDVYFGRLVDDLEAQQKNAVVFGLLQEPWRGQVSKLKALNGRVKVIPAEAYLTLSDLVLCGLKSLKAYFASQRISGPAECEGIDIGILLKGAIRQARRSGNFLRALRVYYCAKRLAQAVHVERCMYPYENRAWERMLIRGIRDASPKTRMVGYQHASVTLGHTNFILVQEEPQIVPLPDAIVTTGPLVKEWLEREGNYPAGMLKTGCALRQSSPNGAVQARNKSDRITNVLVVLATSLDEYVNTLVFLEKAFSGSTGYEVRIRPHPTIPLESAVKIAPLSRTEFYSPSTGPLMDALQWADVVLYASSTVGMEAVSLGIPAIYLDLGNFLDTDPMFGWSEFKWSVREPAELIDAIRKIEAVPSSTFSELQLKSREYVSTYLSPATAGSVHTFLEA